MTTHICFSFLLALIVFSTHVFGQSEQLASFEYDQYGGPSKGVEYNGKLYFSAWDAATGRELWVTDGTPQGTYMVRDNNPGTASSITNYFELKSYVFNNILYFLADDGAFGTELWRTNGTELGTYMVRDCVPGSGGSVFYEATKVGSMMYFIGGNGTALWRSDGTNQGTTAVQSFQILRGLTSFNGNLFFAAAMNNEGEELWKCNGNTTVCTQIVDVNGAFGASLPINFHVTPAAFYFMANTNAGWELWKSGGTAATTSMVKDIYPGNGNGVLTSYSVSTVVSIGNTVYFRATDGVTGFQLWKSDGTEAGTQRISDFADAVLPEIGYPIANGKVHYTSYAQNFFWSYDPITGITEQSNYPAYYHYAWEERYKMVGDVLVYAHKDTAYGCEVWRADGSSTGIRRVQETDLVDNWSPDFQQYFNRIKGSLGANVFYTNGRTHYNGRMPLYVYKTSDEEVCHAPSLVIPVPLTATSTHVVWNRPTDEATYEFRYMLAGGSAWITSATVNSYKELNNLTASSDYLFQVRAYCNGAWTAWSESTAYNSAFASNLSHIQVIAEKAENPTTERIYWLTSPQFAGIQLRYRPYGSATWQTTGNTSGYKRLQNLMPSTLYEYQVRINYGSGTEEWPYGSRYFVTATDVVIGINEVPSTSFALSVYPNPAADAITITMPTPGGVTIVNALGEVIATFRVDQPTTFSLQNFAAGQYFLQSSTGATGSFVKTN
jgi:ELWxxDGT repeat protein